MWNWQTGHGRTFLQENGPGPGNPYEYLGCVGAAGFTWSKGDVTQVECPDPETYDEFEVIDEVRGATSLPTSSLTGRFGLVNPLLELACPFDVQLHFGKTREPTNFNEGWDIIVAYWKCRDTNISSDDLVAIESGARATITVTMDFSSRRLWFIYPVAFSAAAADETTREVVGVALDDRPRCAAGAEIHIFAVTVTSGVSPGMLAELIYSLTGSGGPWMQEDIDTLAIAEDPTDLAQIGNYVIVTSKDTGATGGGSWHYAHIDDLDTWVEVDPEDANFQPNRIFVLSPTQIWFACDSGYIYFTDDYLSTAGLVSQHDADATSEHLLDIHGVDSLFLLCVGENGAILMTQDGGAVWAASAAIPAVATVDYQCCWMRTRYVWLVGANDDNLYFTEDEGDTWYNKNFPGKSGTGVVFDCDFVYHPDGMVGYMAYATAASNGAGRVYRSLDGGFSWYVLPEGAGAIPANDRINRLAVNRDVNFAIAGGLGDDALDGILLIIA